jgi:hypothetical protein
VTIKAKAAKAINLIMRFSLPEKFLAMHGRGHWLNNH